MITSSAVHEAAGLLEGLLCSASLAMSAAQGTTACSGALEDSSAFVVLQAAPVAVDKH
jgi:hypothetical protein